MCAVTTPYDEERQVIYDTLLRIPATRIVLDFGAAAAVVAAVASPAPQLAAGVRRGGVAVALAGARKPDVVTLTAQDCSRCMEATMLVEVLLPYIVRASHLVDQMGAHFRAACAEYTVLAGLYCRSGIV